MKIDAHSHIRLVPQVLSTWKPRKSPGIRIFHSAIQFYLEFLTNNQDFLEAREAALGGALFSRGSIRPVVSNSNRLPAAGNNDRVRRAGPHQTYYKNTDTVVSAKSVVA
jgi:hypothetical protein